MNRFARAKILVIAPLVSLLCGFFPISCDPEVVNPKRMLTDKDRIQEGSCAQDTVRTIYRIWLRNVQDAHASVDTVTGSVRLRVRDTDLDPWSAVRSDGSFWTSFGGDNSFEIELSTPASDPVGSVIIRYDGELHSSRLLPAYQTLTTRCDQPAVDVNALYVNASADEGGDGESWDTAFKFLRDALDEAKTRGNIERIRVARGFYCPPDSERFITVPGSRIHAFALLPGVGLFGGYDPITGERDIDENTTVLTGDLEDDDAMSGVIVEDDRDRDDNSLHVLNMTGVDASAQLDGFTVTGGHAIGGFGGGMLLRGASPTIRDCRFVRNFASIDGGAVAIVGAPTIYSCWFEDNHAAQGAAITVGFDAAANRTLVDGCAFVANGATLRGGAIYCEPLSKTTLNACRILGNSDGVYAWGASEGGDLRISKSQFSGNGVGLTVSHKMTAAVHHCTFAQNVPGGLIVEGRFEDRAEVTIADSIFWSNADATGASDEAQQILIGPDATVTIRFSLVQGFDEIGTRMIVEFPGKMVNGDPLFRDAPGSDDRPGTPDDDLSTRAGSPANREAQDGTDMGSG